MKEVNKKVFKKNVYISVFKILIILFCSLYILTSNERDIYGLLFLLPLSYLILNIVYNVLIMSVNMYDTGIVYRMVHIFIFIRYVITPFSVVLTQSDKQWAFGPEPTKGNVELAIVLMILELFFVYLAIFFTTKKYSNKKNIMHDMDLDIKNNSTKIISLYFIISVILVLLFSPQLFMKESYFILEVSNTIDTLVQSDVPFYGLFEILTNTSIMLMFIITVIVMKKKYIKNPRNIYIYISYAGLLVQMGLKTGETRMQIILAAIIGIHILYKVFPKTPKIFIGSVIGICIISIISISIYKFTWRVSNSNNPYIDILKVMLTQFQDYFAGPRVVAQSLEMRNLYKYDISLSTFINDFTGSIPLISNYVDQNNRINEYFNRFCGMYKTALIIPVIGIGYNYVPAFPFIFSMIFEYFAVRLDYKAQTSSRIYHKYIYIYMGITCAMYLGYNTQIIFGRFISTFLPLLILFKINDSLTLRSRNKN